MEQGVRLWDQSGCERRSEVFVKIKKTFRGGVKAGGSRGGVRSGGGRVGGQGGWERRSEAFVKIQKKNFFFFFGGGGGGGGGQVLGVRVDVNREVKFL